MAIVANSALGTPARYMMMPRSVTTSKDARCSWMYTESQLYSSNSTRT